MMDFFKKHDIFPVVTAILAAIMLWVYVITTETPEITVSQVVPLHVEGLRELSEAGLSIINEVPEAITVQLRGRRDLIMNLTSEKITATMNISSIFKSGDYKMGYTVKVDMDGISIVQKTPTQIALTVDQLTQMDIPVEVHTTGQLAQGLELKEYQLQTDTITVYGPLRSLEKIQKAITVVDLSAVAQSGSITAKITLVDEKEEEVKDSHLSFEDEVGVTVSLHSVGNASLSVEVLTTDFITKDMVTVEIKPSSVKLKGAKDKISGITDIKLGTIDIGKAVETGSFEYTFAIPLPDGVTLEDNIQQATVTVGVKGIVEKTLEIPNTLFAPLEGFEYLTDSLSVKMWLSEADAATITPEDVSVVIAEDITGLDPSQTNRLAVTIKCEKYTILPIGKYFIEVANIE